MQRSVGNSVRTIAVVRAADWRAAMEDADRARRAWREAGDEALQACGRLAVAELRLKQTGSEDDLRRYNKGSYALVDRGDANRRCASPDAAPHLGVASLHRAARALLELLANPDVGALVMGANDALLRRHFAALLARLHELREGEVRR